MSETILNNSSQKTGTRSKDEIIAITLRNSVRYGKMLIDGKGAILEWTGDALRLELDESGEEIFNVRPSDITRISDYQRLSINFFIKGKKYSVYFPAQVADNLNAQMVGAYAPELFSGASVQLQHDLSMSSPFNKWLDLFHALDIQVKDITFAPSTAPIFKVFFITLGIIIAIPVIVFIVIIITTLISGHS